MRWVLAVVVGHALVQTLLVFGDSVPALNGSFVLATVASAAALLVAVWFLANLAVGEAPWRRPAVLGRVALLAVAGALLAGLFVGGPVGALVTWLWFGAVTAFVLWRWAALSRSRGGTGVDLRADPDALALGAEQARSHGQHD